MNSTGVLFGQVSMVIIVTFLGMWIATQWTADALGFQMRLGPPWIRISGFPVYHPWRVFEWWYAFEAYAPQIFQRAGTIFASSSFLAAALAIASSIFRARQSRQVTTYGSARWATSKDVKAACLTQRAGIFVGQLASRYLRHDGPEHVMAFSPTRSGKGAGLVVPTLLSWQHSAVIHDIKGENWHLTAGWRSRATHCLYFNPTDPRSCKHNILLEVRKGTDEVRDVQNIADILVDPEGMLERRSHWDKTSHSLLVSAILHVLYSETDKTLHGVASLLSDPRQPVENTLARMMATKHLGDRPHPVVAHGARELLNKSENERSGVLSTAMSFLGLYRDPTVAHVTSACDWRISDLVTATRPVSLYLVVPPSDISRTKPLIRLILNQIGRRLTETLTVGDGSRDRHRVLFLLDEFPTLGRLDFFESALSFMAGYGLRSLLIAQSLNQIEKAYGPNNSILDNCHVRVAFACNDERTAKRISDALGTSTELRAQRNYAGHRLSPWLGHLMVSRQETARPLLTPGEVMQLPADDAIVMVSGHPPIRARKIRYFADSNFTSRVLPPPVLSHEAFLDRPPAQPDDWTGRAPPPPPVQLASLSGGPDFVDAGGGIQHASAISESREPSRQHSPSIGRDDHQYDLAFIDDEDDSADTQEPETQRALNRSARLVALDPADGIPL